MHSRLSKLLVAGVVHAERKIFNPISVPIAVARNLYLQMLGLVIIAERRILPLLFAQNVALKSQIRPGIAHVAKEAFNPISVPIAEINGVKCYADLHC